jgi:hypothetical protein
MIPPELGLLWQSVIPGKNVLYDLLFDGVSLPWREGCKDGIHSINFTLFVSVCHQLLGSRH